MSRRPSRPPPHAQAHPPAPADLAAHAARGVRLYNAGRYWEAHEALEIVWRASAPPQRDLWQGLIQAAAAMLHRERGNRHGLLTQGEAAIRKLRVAAAPGFPVETVQFVQGLQRCVEAGGPVPPMVPLDPRLSRSR